MKKVIALVLILVLIFTLGCGGKAKTSPAERVSGPVKEVAVDEPATTSDAVSEVESDLGDIERLDEDFLTDDLDALDSELDFEI